MVPSTLFRFETSCELSILLWKVFGMVKISFPSRGQGFAVLKVTSKEVASPATLLTGTRVGVTPLNPEGVKTTAEGSVEEPAVAWSILVLPSESVVLRSTNTPLEPSYFWFVTEGKVIVTETPAAISEPPLRVIVTARPVELAARLPSIPAPGVAAEEAIAWKVVGNSTTIFPSAGIGFSVVKTKTALPEAPATKLAGATVVAMPPNVLGVKVTALGRVDVAEVASSILVDPSLKVVLRATKTPELPSYFWLVMDGMVMVTSVPASITAPSPLRVMVTARPEVLAVKEPSIPLPAVAAEAETATKVVGNSTTIFPSAGIGFPVVKTRSADPVPPATRLAGVTVLPTPPKVLGVKVTAEGRVDEPDVASSILAPELIVV
jgi:hypothetical protein